MDTHPVITAIKSSWGPIAVVAAVLIYAYLDGKKWHPKRIKPKTAAKPQEPEHFQCRAPYMRSHRKARRG